MGGGGHDYIQAVMTTIQGGSTVYELVSNLAYFSKRSHTVAELPCAWLNRMTDFSLDRVISADPPERRSWKSCRKETHLIAVKHRDGTTLIALDYGTLLIVRPSYV